MTGFGLENPRGQFCSAGVGMRPRRIVTTFDIISNSLLTAANVARRRPQWERYLSHLVVSCHMKRNSRSDTNCTFWLLRV